MQTASPSQSIEQEEDDDSVPVASTSGSDSFLERSRYIPLRLQPDERRLLRLLEAALSVSEYTDKVDVINWKSKTARIHAQIKDICAILSGLVVAQNYKKGQQLVQVTRCYLRTWRLSALLLSSILFGFRYATLSGLPTAILDCSRSGWQQ